MPEPARAAQCAVIVTDTDAKLLHKNDVWRKPTRFCAVLQVEANRHALGIEEYSLSQTTLEQVRFLFLRFLFRGRRRLQTLAPRPHPRRTSCWRSAARISTAQARSCMPGSAQPVLISVGLVDVDKIWTFRHIQEKVPQS